MEDGCESTGEKTIMGPLRQTRWPKNKQNETKRHDTGRQGTVVHVPVHDVESDSSEEEDI